MEFLTHLWLPILASAAAVWIASAIAWMAVGHHKKDWKGLPNEDAFLDYVRSSGIPPGNYGFPHFAGGCNTPEAKAKWERGPLGLLNVWGKMSMGRNMVLTFIVYLVVSAVIAYLAYQVPMMGVSFKQTFRFVGTAGVLAYSFAFLPNGIWFQQYPRTMAMNVIDGIVFGLITGLVFAALWPGH